MIELKIERAGIDELRKRGSAWPALVRRQLLPGVAELTVRQAKKRVRQTKASPDAKRWAPRKSGGSWPLLMKSRRMVNSIKRRRQSADEFHAGAEAPYAKFHHTGTRTMEARQFIGVGLSDTREIEALIQTFVELHF